MKNHFLKSVLTAGLLAFTLAAPAEDIDLFVGATPTATEVPNVLILLDNTANWNGAFTNEIAALAATLNGLTVDKFRVGLMMFTETGGGNSGIDGGYIRAAIRLMNSANKTKYQALVNSLGKISDKSNGGKAGNTMVDVYRYFSGAAPYSGNNKVKTDYTGNVLPGMTASNDIYALLGNALSSKAGTPYTSPIVSGCAKNFIIYISNGAAQDNASDTSSATTALSSAGGSTTAIPISPTGSQSNVADEWARWMKKSSQNIVTYTVDVDKVTTGQGPGWTALLKSMAGVSSGKYFDVSSSSGVNGAAISAALAKIFSEIQAVNSVFASVSLPVSVSTQGTYLNQVYVGMFRPDQDAFPRWAGNLKQYKIGYVNNVLKLQDADSADANNNQTGFITECARSFWTPTTTDSYWAFKPQGGCLAVANSDISNYPDGNVVEKGGQAYKLRSVSTCTGSPETCTIATPRTVKTCSATFASCTTLTNFNNTNVSAAMLTPVTSPVTPTLSTTERDALINWEIGQDVDDENINGQATTEMRPYAHGDVVHSRPIAFNFGTDASPQVVVFYSGNDGMLRAINGNRPDKPTPNIGSVTPGSELWAFVAPEFYPKIKRIHDNTTQISFPNNTTGTPTPLPKPYGIDGPITGYQGNISGTPKAFIYATMRRGGRALYAFDVTTPASPTLKWKKGCPNNFPSSGTVDDTNCTPGFSGIGQTWSAPHNFKSAGYGSGTSPMLIMGGGYDTCEDADPHTCTSANKGNKVYVMDADTGALLKTLDTDRGVAGDVTVVPDQTTGLAEYAYATDLGGNIYRISGIDANTPMGSTAPGNWTITKVASLGGTGTAARKFMFSTDVVKDNGTYLLLVGSGDREKPLLSYTTASAVTNYFFMVKDKPTDASWLTSENATCGASVICLNSLTPTTTPDNASAATLAASKGWYLGLSPTEQVVTSAITLYGVVTFSTHQPAVVAAGSCGSNLGQTRVYNVNYKNAAPSTGTSRYADLAGDGLPPSPVLATVTLDDGRTITTVFGSSEHGPIPPGPPPPPVPGTSEPTSRVYWYIQQ